MGAIPEDPLDMRTEIPYLFTNVCTAALNDNTTSLPAGTTSISGSEYLRSNGTASTNYFIDDWNIGTSALVTIDAQLGPINLFLRVSNVINFGNDSELLIKNATSARDVKIYIMEDSPGDFAYNNTIVQMGTGVTINIANSQPTAFSILSNTDAIININNDGEFRGSIYAPDATVNMNNDGDVYGAIFANKVYLKSNAVVFYDTALQNKWISKEVYMTGWTQVLN